MRSTLLVLCLLLTTMGFGQSLGELAKKEKERREKNKEEGKEVFVISGDALAPESETGSENENTAEATTARPSSGVTLTPTGPRRSEEEERRAIEDDLEEDEIFVPTQISIDASLEDRLQLFRLMKQGYERQVVEIDKSIAENDESIRQLDGRIAAATWLGGGGLPVPPQTGTGAATTPMTGQDAAHLVGEQDRLKSINETLRKRKEELKTDLQAKGRAAGIPPGHLRF